MTGLRALPGQTPRHSAHGLGTTGISSKYIFSAAKSLCTSSSVAPGATASLILFEPRIPISHAGSPFGSVHQEFHLSNLFCPGESLDTCRFRLMRPNRRTAHRSMEGLFFLGSHVPKEMLMNKRVFGWLRCSQTWTSGNPPHIFSYIAAVLFTGKGNFFSPFPRFHSMLLPVPVSSSWMSIDVLIPAWNFSVFLNFKYSFAIFLTSCPFCRWPSRFYFRTCDRYRLCGSALPRVALVTLRFHSRVFLILCYFDEEFLHRFFIVPLYLPSQ